MRIAVIGAGNGGQAIAGYLAMIGYSVTVYDRNEEKIARLSEIGCITLEGKISGIGRVACFTTSIAEAISDADIVMVATVANAHADIAYRMSAHIKKGQIIVLNPGRTCGSLVFKHALEKSKSTSTAKYYLAEAQTLVYACRAIELGKVNIIGIKDEVLLSALPASDTDYVLSQLQPLYPCFSKAENVFRIGLENIGAMFHPCVCLFNAATIERQDEFWFYRDMTPQVARFIELFDEERLAIGRAYGINLLSVKEWIKYAYKGTQGNTLCELMQNNPAYHDIKAPGSIFTRQLTEDIPTGVIPLIELGQVAHVETPLLSSMVHIIEGLLQIDLYTESRNVRNLGLSGKDKEQIIRYINEGK